MAFALEYPLDFLLKFLSFTEIDKTSVQHQGTWWNGISTLLRDISTKETVNHLSLCLCLSLFSIQNDADNPQIHYQCHFFYCGTAQHPGTLPPPQCLPNSRVPRLQQLQPKRLLPRVKGQVSWNFYYILFLNVSGSTAYMYFDISFNYFLVNKFCKVFKQNYLLQNPYNF